MLYSLSQFRLFGTPWTVVHQAPLSMGFPRQESWSGLPFPPPGDLPNPRIKPTSPALAGGFFTTEPAGKPFMKPLWRPNKSAYMRFPRTSPSTEMLNKA